jgi:large subunit ribosomal protein L22
MRAVAKVMNVSLSAQKCRLWADAVRNLSVSLALQKLDFGEQKSAKIIKKLLESAIANADHNEGADIDRLYVLEIYVDKVGGMKRLFARAKGRGDRVEKQRCHIGIVVGYKRGK